MKRFACITCQGVFDGPAHFHGEAGPFCYTHVQESLAAKPVSVALFPPKASEQVSTSPLNGPEMGLGAKKEAEKAPDAPPAPAPKPKKRWFGK